MYYSSDTVFIGVPFRALTVLAAQQEGHSVCKNPHQSLKRN